MKKLKSLLLASIVLLVLFACEDSQNVVPQKNEAYYKKELEKILHTEFKPIANLKSKNNDGIKFNSYKEAYIYFNSFDNHVITRTETTLPEVSTPSNEKGARIESSGVDQKTYRFLCTDIGSFNYLIGSGSVTAIYTVAVTANHYWVTGSTGLNKSYTSVQLTGTTATTPTMTYSGNYSASTVSPTIVVNPSAGTGVYTGSFQGNAIIMGTQTGSFTVLYRGSFSTRINTIPETGAVCIHSMTASLL